MSEPSVLDLVVCLDGAVSCIYDELLDLRQIGTLSITRASHVEPDAAGDWWADMGPSGGPVLGPYGNRSEALMAEKEWLASVQELHARPRPITQLLPSPPVK